MDYLMNVLKCSLITNTYIKTLSLRRVRTLEPTFIAWI